jgi:sugar lactone lactonase YvrE
LDVGERCLYWVDIDRGEVHRFDPETRRDTLMITLDRQVGAVRGHRRIDSAADRRRSAERTSAGLRRPATRVASAVQVGVQPEPEDERDCKPGEQRQERKAGVALVLVSPRRHADRKR